MRILLTGGGSGGHIYPILAIIRKLKKIASDKGLDLDLVVVSDSDFGREVIEREGARLRRIKAGKFRRFPSLRMAKDFLLIPVGFAYALFIMWQEMPDCVMGNGGYVEVPVAIVAWLYRIPLLIHESDAVPGLANRLLARLAARIGASFSATCSHFEEHKAALVGNPIRTNIMTGRKEEAEEILGISTYKKGLLVLGGSQGARQINEIISQTAPQLLENIEIVHQCGERNEQEVTSEVNQSLNKQEKDSYHLKSFLDEEELKAAYAWADLVVARAGAGLIFEIAACGLPSILLPLPGAAYDHQKKNAYAYSNYGACRVLETANLKPSIFVDEIERLLDNPQEREKMGRQAQQFARPEAAQLVAEELIALAS